MRKYLKQEPVPNPVEKSGKKRGRPPKIRPVLGPQVTLENIFTIPHLQHYINETTYKQNAPRKNSENRRRTGRKTQK